MLARVSASDFRQIRPRTADLWLLGSLCLCLLSTPDVVKAQIIRDETLSNYTVVLPNGSTVEGGTRVGDNLFHSFQEFSVPAGKGAFFNNAADIQNIFSRVTGGKISQIEGLIRTNGTANLFLINPHGIIFGPNAQLSIGGSFIASTANSIKFADGGEFSAINPQAPSLLTINVPLGLQFGANPAPIVNQSVATSFFSATPRVGLETLPGKTLALVGGDLRLLGGNLTALQGQIELGSVQSSGLVSFTSSTTGFTWGYQGIEDFGNIELTGGSAVNASGLGGGIIRVRGGQVTLRSGSRFVAETFGSFNGGGIDIEATQFKLQEGALVSTSTFGSGAGGNLTVQADAVELTGTTPSETSLQLLVATFNPFNLNNGLFSLSGGSGAAGNITIDTDQLRVQNGANLLTTTFVNGVGGDITLKVSGMAELSNGSLLFTGTTGTGDAGNLTVTAQQFRVLDGTALSTTPSRTSTGRGGNLTVTADSVELRGTPAGAAIPDGLFTATLGAGDAGHLTIAAGQMVVADGAQVSASSAGQGRGGNLTVTADAIELRGLAADGRFLSGLFASSSLLTVSGQQGTAPAGNLSVTTRQLRVQNGAQISAATGNDGSAGNLTVNASEFLEVTGFATGIDPAVEKVSFGIIGDGIVPSSIEANTQGAGKAGDLTIQTGRLAVRDGAEIGVRSTRSGEAGNLAVTADSILLEQQGTLSAVKVSGAGGNIALNTRTLTLNNSTITATSLLGQGGNINLQVQEGTVLRNQSQITTRAGTEDTGGGDGGNITINTDVLAALENSNINANAFKGTGGNIRIITRGIFLSPDSRITASSTLGVDGVVKINQLDVDPSQGLVELPKQLTDSSDQITISCASQAGNSFVITGRGGLPEDPTQTLRGRTVWRDLRNFARVRGQSQERIARHPSATDSQQSTPNNGQIIEAQGWVINSDGQLALVANVSGATPHGAWQRSAECHQQVKG